MIIREMTLGDVPGIHAMGVQEPGFCVSEEGSCFWTEEQLKNWVVENQDVLLVAEENGLIVGFILSALHKPTGKVTWENQYVRPEYRNKGVAKALIDEMIKRLKEKGAEYLNFFVKIDNPFKSYYEKAGFKKGKDVTWFGEKLK